MTDPRAIIELVTFAEGLKNELRHSYTSTGRHESVAEHCWMLCVMALAVFDAVELDVDRMKVLKMLIVHDLPEIITGDIPVFDKLEIAEQAAADEEAALEQIEAQYHMGAEIAALCREFEASETNEAKLARAIDKAEAFIQHNNAPMETWDQ
ncbi:MAG: HD domain-containing protein, partial [Chloroflexota bacterium]